MDPRAWTRFQKNKGAFLGLALVAVATMTAVVGPQVAPHDPNEQFRETLIDARGLPKGPFEVRGHALGADTIGRDELSRLLHGGAVTMLVAFLATALAVSLG
ncbi:MAG: peptide ABC transporter permease, partial [Myxococcota bacterium]